MPRVNYSEKRNHLLPDLDLLTGGLDGVGGTSHIRNIVKLRILRYFTNEGTHDFNWAKYLQAQEL